MALIFAQFDWLDKSITLLFLFASIALPLLGYFFMVVDYRAYLRRIRGVLVSVSQFFPTLPGWACVQSPPCVRALGLNTPCTEGDVHKAYRRLVEKHHPDRGGDRRQFLLLQRHYEESLYLVRSLQPVDSTGT